MSFFFIKNLFAEMGFTGDELEMRTMVFQILHSLGAVLQGSFLADNRLKHDNVLVSTIG